ncbi:DUF7210 family protein [Acinetobacter ursingii]|uniref:DUF7210 family protein n=1 Tax=Acinetobacter ursingii TaxID=108980 RepID=UPI0021CD51F2|nr:hypothetical protein [Acinetobacter ursingii]MCU4601861.1 hypothetical protein [Acinetobacter ursingii]
MSEKTVKTVKVKLLKPHTHGGMKYDTGFELELPEHDANWLKNLTIAEDIKTSAVVAKTTVEEK